MNLSTTTDVIADAVVVGLAGEVDLGTVPSLQDALRRALAHHPNRRLIIDLDGVTVLDDVGLGVLLGAAGSARRSGTDVAVICTNDRLRERLDVTGFSRAVDVRKHLKGDVGGNHS